MMAKIHMAAVSLLLATCDDGLGGTPGSLPNGETMEPEAVPSEQQFLFAERDVCDRLPTEGACAHACDSDALKQFIPHGTCASFVCPLTDGTTYHTGACNL